MIPTRLNPFGMRRRFSWRNFFDNPQQHWSGYEALDLSGVGVLEFRLVFVPSSAKRSNSNAPIFGRWGGDTTPLFTSMDNFRNGILVYVYSNARAYLWSTPNWGKALYDQENTLEVRLEVGAPASYTLNETVSVTAADNYSGFPSIGANVISTFDGEIHELAVSADGRVVWYAPLAALMN